MPPISKSGFSTVEAVIDLNLGVLDKIRNQSQMDGHFNTIDHKIKNAYK